MPFQPYRYRFWQDISSIPAFEHALPYFQAEKGHVKTYQPPLSRLPDALQWPVNLLWDADRIIGKRYTGIQFYLWHESRMFPEADQIADVVRANASEGERVFGDSTTTPLIALLSKVPIADNFVDTNTMRFKAGLPPVDNAIDELKTAIRSTDQRLEWIIVNPARGIARIEAFQRFFNEYFVPFQRFRTQHFGTYILMKRKHEILP